MDALEGSHHRQHQLKHLYRGDRTAAPDIRSEVDAVEIIHDDIGGAVGFKVLSDADDTRLTDEFRDFSRFFQKTVLTLGKHRLTALGRGSDILIDGIIAVHITVGKILLDRNAHIERQISADIGDAEAALADTVADKVLVVQYRTGLKPIDGIVRLILFQTMVTYIVVRDLIHTGITIILHALYVAPF